MERAIAVGGIVCNWTVSHTCSHGAMIFHAKNGKILKMVVLEEIARRAATFIILCAARGGFESLLPS
jgi:hypothetical protein